MLSNDVAHYETWDICLIDNDGFFFLGKIKYFLTTREE